MNPRIREIAAQAKQCAIDAMIKIADKEQALLVYSETYDTTFAELIVRGCIEIIDYNDLVGNSTEYYGTKLKEHFGVEE